MLITATKDDHENIAFMPYRSLSCSDGVHFQHLTSYRLLQVSQGITRRRLPQASLTDQVDTIFKNTQATLTPLLRRSLGWQESWDRRTGRDR
jgi:hypothetical protein